MNNEGHQESLFLIFRAVLNVCFSYTARDEICSAMQELAQGVQDGLIRERYNPSKALDLFIYFILFTNYLDVMYSQRFC